jgi:hypothetical protein
MYTKITSSFYVRKRNFNGNVAYNSALLTVYGYNDNNNKKQYLKSFSERIPDKTKTIPDITKMMLRKRYNDWLKVFKLDNSNCETPKEVIDKSGCKFVSDITTDSRIKKRGYRNFIKINGGDFPLLKWMYYDIRGKRFEVSIEKYIKDSDGKRTRVRKRYYHQVGSTIYDTDCAYKACIDKRDELIKWFEDQYNNNVSL